MEMENGERRMEIELKLEKEVGIGVVDGDGDGVGDGQQLAGNWRLNLAKINKAIQKAYEEQQQQPLRLATRA